MAPATVSFEAVGIESAMADAVRVAGFSRPTAVQAMGMPAICEGKDVVLAAETGSGKTLAYLGPIVDRIAQGKQELEEGGEK
ncbi:unnamed protein product [Ostreobium quekettii]|uniref:DEAD-box RNA helicase Q domain-containing protein n=1 Tax=Ostreobium quekettii TaxID=121088 RepID=A0A8S1JDG5_9CHLO|nr:unnamed protein product [Ostreobium quekettii]